MTFWSLTNSDFPTNQTFHQFHDLDTELDLHRLWVVSMEHLQRVWQQGTLTLPDTWFRPPLWDLLVLQLLRPNSSNLPCLYSTFHLEYPLVLSRFWHISCIRTSSVTLCPMKWKSTRNVKALRNSVQVQQVIREKGRDLTQSYDKSPYTNRNVKRAKWQHKQRHKKVRLHRGCGQT